MTTDAATSAPVGPITRHATLLIEAGLLYMATHTPEQEPREGERMAARAASALFDRVITEAIAAGCPTGEANLGADVLETIERVRDLTGESTGPEAEAVFLRAATEELVRAAWLCPSIDAHDTDRTAAAFDALVAALPRHLAEVAYLALLATPALFDEAGLQAHLAPFRAGQGTA